MTTKPINQSSVPYLIDSHAHLDDARFDPDRDQVLARAQASGIRKIVVPATHYAGWQNLRQICAENAQLYPAFGLHPMFLSDHKPQHIDQLRAFVSSHYCVAIGECGLDFYIQHPQPDTQRYYFMEQLKIARETGLPVIIHARRAVEEVILSIRKIGGLRGVVHSFAGSYEQAIKLRDMGFYISIGGPITYPRAKRLRRMIARIPLEMLLLETDAPDQPCHQHQGERNEPAYIASIVSSIASLRQESEAQIASQTSAQAIKLFALS